MAGRVLGKHFRQVIGQLLAHSEADPAAIADEQAAIAAIEPSAERPWQEFTSTLARVTASVPSHVQVAIGERLVSAAKPEFERWGFDSAEKVLADWDAPFGASIIDAPEEQSVITLKYEQGRAFLRAGDVLPVALIEGYVRGVIAMFGAELAELHCHRVVMNGQPFHLLEVRWRSNPVPRVVGPGRTDRMVLGIRPPQKVA